MICRSQRFGALSVYDIAMDISEGLARAACCGKVDGRVVDLRTVVDGDCELSICTANDAEGLSTIRHTASHVLAEAVKNLFPQVKLAIGPSIDTGFYYDFESDISTMSLFPGRIWMPSRPR